jgi:predicted nucleotidyltransferase
VNDWTGRHKAEASRQWPTLQATITRAAELDVIDGVIVIGSFAQGDSDELSDLDLIVVAAPGGFRDAWEVRRQLAGDVLVAWESRPDPDLQMRWFKWLTRDVVKVECGIVDAFSGGKELAEPFAVLLGDPSLADRFPRISRATVERRAALLAEQQQVFDPDEMTAGERIDWKLSEMKNAVRDALRGERDGARSD